MTFNIKAGILKRSHQKNFKFIDVFQLKNKLDQIMFLYQINHSRNNIFKLKRNK